MRTPRFHLPLALLAAALALAPAGARASSARLAALERHYLDGLFRAKPHLADYMGDHRHAARLSDLSPDGVRRRVGELEAQRAALAAIDRAGLSRDEAVDADILADGIALELLELQEIREWTWNPQLVDQFTYYDPREVVAARLSDLVHGAWATPDSRRRAAAAQLRQLPRWLADRQQALQRVSKVHLDQAIKDNLGRIAFFETELAAFTRPSPEAEAARRAALDALRAHQAFLERTLPARATSSWRLGPALYRRKFPLALQTDATPDALVRLAREDLAAARGELYGLARRLARGLFPGEPAAPEQAPAADQARLIARVRDALAADHPAPDALVRDSAAALGALRAFLDAKRVVALPPPETLSVVVMPEYKRGANGAEYLSPGALDRHAPFHGTYYVDPVDPTWPAAKVESYLRANNFYELTMTAAHEALPGHHTQAWWARRDPSALRATLWSGPFAEGWAVYGERLIVQDGFGDDRNDRYRFFQLRGRLIIAQNAILDVGLQGGSMSDEEALRFMVDEGFQEQALAEKKLLRAKLDSTQLCQYFVGQAELERLERDVRARGGFDQRAFDEALLSHGTIAVKHLRRYLLQQ